MRHSLRLRRLIGPSALLPVLALAGCAEKLPQTVGPAAMALRLALRPDALGSSGDAFARIDAAHVKVSQANGALLDTTVTFAASESQVALAVQLPDPTAAVVVTVELLGNGDVLFRGSGNASAARGATVSVPITVAPVIAGLSAPDSVTLTALGDTLRLQAAAVFATGDTVPGMVIAWTMPAGSILTLRPGGVVVAVSEGQTQVTASCAGFTHVTTVRVQAIVTRVVLPPDTFSLLVGETRALTAVAQDRNGNVLPRTIAWRSADSAVATVEVNGLVRARAPGTTTITAASEAQSDSARVTVRRIPVASVRVTPASGELLPGDTLRLAAMALDSAGNLLSGRAIAWSTGDAAIATVDSTGLVRGVALGSVTITATSEGQSGTATISVAQPLVDATPPELYIEAVQAATPPLTRTVSVFNAGSGTLRGLSAGVDYDPAGPTGWLTSSLASTTAPTSLTVGVDHSGLSLGYRYSATLTIASTVPRSGAVSIPITVLVTQPVILVADSIMAMYLGLYPSTRQVQVDNDGSGTLSGLRVAVTYADTATGWLGATLDDTTAPTTLTLTLLPPALQLSPPHIAIVTITSTVPGAGVQYVTVRLQTAS